MADARSVPDLYVARPAARALKRSAATPVPCWAPRQQSPAPHWTRLTATCADQQTGSRTGHRPGRLLTQTSRRERTPPVPTSGSAAAPPRAAGHLIRTRTGQTTVTRRASEADRDAVNEMHARCCLESRYSRYQAARRDLSAAQFGHLVHPDRGLSWVTHPADCPYLVIAVANLMRTDDERIGDLGLLVEDAWQSRGLGSALTRYTIAQAPALGVHAISVMTGRDNRRMLSICRTLGAHSPRASGTTIDLTLPVA